MKDKNVKTFIIQNRLTKQQWKARSGKVAWATKTAAKNAFAYNYQYLSEEHLPIELKPYFKENKYGRCEVYFDSQDAYEIVELKAETMIAVENLTPVFNSIKENNFVLTEEHKQFISDFVNNYK